MVRFSTKTDSLAAVEMDGDVVGSLEAEAIWAFISTPVPTAMPTAARSAVWA